MIKTSPYPVRFFGGQSIILRSGFLAWCAAVLIFLGILGTPVFGQSILSVPFTNGFVGKDDGSPNNAVETFTFAGIPGTPAGGITGAYFAQDVTSATTQFQSCAGSSFLVGATLDLCSGSSVQGNDVPGFITLIDTAGNAYRFGGYFNFRGPSGKVTTYVFRVLESKTVHSLSFTAEAISATNDNSNYALIGLVLIGETQVNTVTSGGDGNGTFSGNAASTAVLNGLNDYLTEVGNNRPSGPVTVTTQTTTDTTPSITGTVTLGSGETLSVVVNGVKYTQGDGKLSVSSGIWTLQIPSAMPLATYSVDAMITDSTGYTLSDTTSSELVITSGPRFVDGSSVTVTTYADSYAENSTSLTVLTTVHAVEGTGTLSYSIVSNALNGSSQPLFAINSSTGTISLTAAGVAAFSNDYETLANVHVLTVRASDGTNTVDATVTLTETNTAEGSLSGHVTKANGAAQSGLTVTLYDAGGTVLGTTTTNGAGLYSFTGLSGATYKVGFGNQHSGTGVRGKSRVGVNGDAQVTQVVLTEATALTDVDGFVVDPSGVVYSSTTRLPVAGAVVELWVTPTGGVRREVADAELDTDLGDASGVTTGATGLYSFLLRDTAPTGVYDLVVTHADYVSPSTVLTAATGPKVTSLGGGAESIQTQATAPTGSQPTTYYLSFSFTFTSGDPSATSNGVVNNHIPLDPIQAAMTVTKTASLGGSGGVEDTVTWTILAKNTGNVALTGVTPTDTLTRIGGGALTPTGPSFVSADASSAEGSLAVGETATYTASYMITADDVTAGGVENLVSFTANDPNSDPITVESSAAGNATPGAGQGSPTQTAIGVGAMELTKTATLPAEIIAGQVVNYTITLTNTGSQMLTDVSLSDSLTNGSATVSQPTLTRTAGTGTTMAPGDVWTWTTSYTLTQADINTGQIENLATATATDDSGTAFDVESSASGNGARGVGNGAPTVSLLTGTPKLSLTHVLTSQVAEFPAVELDTFTLVFTNTGGVELNNVSLRDALGAGFSPSTLIEVLEMTGLGENGGFDGDGDTELFAPSTTLMPGASVTFVVRVRVWRDLTVTSSTITATATADGITTPVTADAILTYADADADGVDDGDESPTDDRDGDGVPDAQDYDPMGYFYCEDDGKILTGGGISVSGPLGSNSTIGTANGITIVRDGSDGQFQWFVIAPGTYTMAVTYPSTGSASTTRLASPTLDVTTLLPDDPAVLGSTEVGSTGYLASAALSDNPLFYKEFDIQAGDPQVLANNIPMTDCGDNGVTVTKHADGAESNGGTPTPGSFRVTLSRPALQDTVITYTITGNATSGSDFTTTIGTVTILAGQTTADITLDVIEDSDIEGSETVTITLDSATSADPKVVLGGSVTADVEITDDDSPDIRFDGTDLDGTEDGDLGEIDVHLTVPPTGTVTVSFASDGQCTFSPSSMTFDASNFSVPQALTVTPILDSLSEGTHICTPIVTVSSLTDSDYDGITATPPDVTITESDDEAAKDALKETLQDDLRATVRTIGQDIRALTQEAGDRLWAPCGDSDLRDRALDANITDGIGSLSQSLRRQTRDCVAGRYRAYDFGLRIERRDADTGDTALTYRLQYRNMTERQNDNDIEGRFWGLYISSSQVDAAVAGQIDGYGAMAGLYHARASRDKTMFFQDYIAFGLGQHQFDLTYPGSNAVMFDGSYGYGAIWLGASLGGVMEQNSPALLNNNIYLHPRIGVDLSLGLPTDATGRMQSGISISGFNLGMDPVILGRYFVQLDFGSLNGDQDPMAQDTTRWSIKPELFCDVDLEQLQSSCGYGAVIELTLQNRDKDSDLRLQLGVEIAQAETRTQGAIIYHHRTQDGGEISAEIRHSTENVAILSYAKTF